MKTAKLLLLAVLPMLVGCNGNKTDSSDADSVLSSIDSFGSSSDTSEDSSVWSEHEITLAETDKIIAKAETFNDKVSKLEYYRKDGQRHDEIEYKRYPNFYTLEGTADSYTDAWDESTLIGYYGYPSDGSIDKFYDVLKADVGTQHAKLYTIDDNATSSDVTKKTEEEADEMLGEYENDLTHFMDETYFVLRKDKFDEYKNKGSLKAERYTKDGVDTLHIVAEYDYTFLNTTYHADYDWMILINPNGSFASAHFTLDDGGVKTYNNIDMTYGDFYNANDLEEKFNPEMYFSKKLEIKIQDLYTKDENSVSVGSSLYFMPNVVKNYMGSYFSYLPATAVDYWDIDVIGSSNEEIIGYSEEEERYVAKKPGVTTITIGNIYNPYSITELEVTVVVPKPTAILAHTPYNSASYVGEAFTNCDVHLDVSVGPTSASQEMVATSSDESIATVYVNDDGEVMVHGVSNGQVTIAVSPKDYPEISKEFTFRVNGEFGVNKIVGTWEDHTYYSMYSFKMQYTFNEDLTGTFVYTALNYSNEEVTNTVPFTYVLDNATQQVTITPIGWTMQEDLKSIHYYNSDLMKCYFTYSGYSFPINMNKAE